MLNRHLILCGFMACGKSTVGALCAASLETSFTDTDTLIELREQKSIPAIFAERGEAAFRDLEHETCLRLTELSPRVIATGGGLPTFARNLAPLHAAGTVIFIDRTFDGIWDSLSQRTGRPLASGRSREEMLALWEKRYPLYQAAADYTVVSDGTAEDCARKILALVREKNL